MNASLILAVTFLLLLEFPALPGFGPEKGNGHPGGLSPPGTFGGAASPAFLYPCHRSEGRSPCAWAAPNAINLSWVNLTAALDTFPAPRFSSSLAYDASDGYFLLFGGAGAKGSPRQDSWEFNGHNWTNITSATVSSVTTPPSRQGGSMVYDSTDGYVVMFGGKGTNGPLSDTWTFHLGAWSNISSTAGTAPLARTSASISDDPADGSVILFGGRTATLLYRDTWSFAAGKWTNLTATFPHGAPMPPRRYNASMAYDTAGTRVVLVGGITYSGGNYSTANDAWTFSNSSWSQMNSTVAPSARSSATLGFNPTTGSLLLFGGASAVGARLSDSWSLSGASWQDVTSTMAPGPTGRFGAASAGSPVGAPNSLLLLFGGSDARSGADRETWAVGNLPLTLGSINATPAAVDVGFSTTLGIGVFGGTPPYNFVWNTLPGCASQNKAVFTCHTKTVGRAFAVTVQVRDAAGTTQTSTPLLISVNPLLSITQFTSSPFTVIVGRTKVLLNVSAIGGTPPFNYSFTSLPTGCAKPTNNTVSCVPTQAGGYNISVTVTDAEGATASAYLLLQVGTPPPAGSTNLLVLGLIVAIVVGAALVTLVVVRRRRRLAPPPETPPKSSG